LYIQFIRKIIIKQISTIEARKQNKTNSTNSDINLTSI